MGINDQKVEMLFIDAQTRSKGYGRKSFGPISDKNISKIQKTAGILAVRLI